MLQLRSWKNILICIFCAVSAYLALPTLLTSQHSWLPNNKVNLGLDLRGGVLMLLEVESKQYLQEQKDYLSQQLSELISHRCEKVYQDGDKLMVKFLAAPDSESKNLLQEFVKKVGYLDLTINDATASVSFTEEYERQLSGRLMDQTMEIVRRRVDELGTKEIDLQRQGDNCIALQVPGITNPDEIKKLLGKTAKLLFSLVDVAATNKWYKSHQLQPGSRILNSDHGPIAVQSKAALTGDMLVSAHVTMQNNMPGVSISFNDVGSSLFAELTSKNTHQRLAIILDDKVLSAPVINEPILGGSSFISGNFTAQSAGELAIMLRSGALPARINIVEERIVGPTLGSDSINSGINAVILGGLAVMLIMGLCYGIFGMVANLAMLVNLLMIIAALSLFGATLTLPGIAGMVLTLGMAVDANVLIFERMREEVRRGCKPFAAITGGYSAAFITILDSNLTTMLAALILYSLGSGPIRGFAVTLSIGIVCSMFTSITLTRVMLDWWYRRYRPKILPL